eukprot:2678785-Pyramimonas_sp.AAC.1
MASHAVKIKQDFRCNLVGDPRSSSICAKSPLSALLGHLAQSEHRCNTCTRAFSKEKGGRRNEKGAALISAFCLGYPARRCGGKKVACACQAATRRPIGNWRQRRQ